MRLAAAVIGAGCIAAAGVGGYLAVRADRASNQAEARVQADPPRPDELRRESPAPEAALPADRAGAARVEQAADVPRLVPPPGPVLRPGPVPPLTPAVEPDAVERYVPSRERPADAPAVIPAKADPPPPVTSPPLTLPPVADPQSALPPAPTTTSVLELPPPPDAPVARPRVEELTVAEGSVMGIRLETGLSSETARVEDAVSATVTRDVTVDGVTAIPAGSRLEGHVSTVERGGRFRERARLGIRFTTLVLDDKTRLRIDTDAISRDGESPTGEATSKIGASAVVGSILGAMIGGRKGAAIGGAAGAAGGSAAVASGGRNAATIAEGAALTVRFTRPLTVQIERERR